MPFTDEDWERVKRLNQNSAAWGDSEMGFLLDVFPFALARLEAAEKAIEAWEILSAEWHSRVRGVKDEFEKRMAKSAAMEAWRKAAGK